MTQAELYAFLASHRLAVLSTITPQSSSQSALVGIAVTPALELVFDTVKSSRKYSNLIANAACSLVVGWTAEQTVQYEGTAHQLSGSELTRCQEIYFKTWPECIPHQKWPDIAYFVVKPKWLRYSDFGHTPPLILEFSC